MQPVTLEDKIVNKVLHRCVLTLWIGTLAKAWLPGRHSVNHGWRKVGGANRRDHLDDSMLSRPQRDTTAFHGGSSYVHPVQRSLRH